jgi:hypothetical protein
MKLRNKKSGEIIECPMIRMSIGVCDLMRYEFPNSLAELNEEWEDYEEQCWYINSTGEVREGILDADWRDERRIGNYFETKEEAEKAIEKLKAWKRLSENKYLFNRLIDLVYSLNANCREYDEYLEDIELLFGGEK